MGKNNTYKEFEKEEWELTRLVDFYSTKLALKPTGPGHGDGPTLNNLTRAIKNSNAFRKTFRDTSLTRLRNHISYLIHRGALSGKTMSCRGVVPASWANSITDVLVHQADVVRDNKKLTVDVDTVTRTAKQLLTKLSQKVS